MENVNRNHKNSVFSSLFSTPDVLRELYSAIEGIPIPPDIPIDINTLTNAIYKGQINDVSFLIDNRFVVLIEHQSTVNNNIPLRLLMYIARVYEKIVKRRKRYQSNLEKIPRPEFIVLYNGEKKYPDYEVLKLSDAFKDIEGLKLSLSDAVPLELIVEVYNVNHGHNSEMLKRSETLDGYSMFIDKIREYQKQEKSLEEAGRSAINYCIENNILKDYLEANASEVLNMLLGEWDQDEALEVAREEGIEEGMEKAHEEDRQYFLDLLNQGLTIEEIKERLQQEEKVF
jgi:hypothetical protein